MCLKQGNVLPCGATAAKAGGGLDKLGAGFTDHAAHFDLFLIRQQAGLDDHLQQLTAAVRLHRTNLLQNLIVQAVLDPADVDDHVDFIGAVFHRVGRFEAFYRGGRIAVGEADHRADGDFPRRICRRLLHIGSRNTDAGAAIADTVVTNGLDLRPGGILRQ